MGQGAGDEHGEGPGKGERKGSWRRLSPEARWTSLFGPLILLGVGFVAALLGVAAKNALFDSEPEPELTALPSYVTDGRSREEELLASPRVTVRLHNRGSQRAAITTARIEVLEVVELLPCAVGGYGATQYSGGYGISLPPRKGYVAQPVVNQQLGPDEVDRFGFNVQLRKAEFGAAVVFLLQLSLHHDNEDEPLDIGKALVFTPAEPPDRANRSLALGGGPHFLRFTTGGHYTKAPAREIDCLARQRHRLQALNRTDAVRSTGLQGLLDYAETRPPRAFGARTAIEAAELRLARRRARPNGD